MEKKNHNEHRTTVTNKTFDTTENEMIVKLAVSEPNATRTQKWIFDTYYFSTQQIYKYEIEIYQTKSIKLRSKESRALEKAINQPNPSTSPTGFKAPKQTQSFVNILTNQ